MLKFIKTYWLHLVLVLFASFYFLIEVANQEWADVIFALAFVVTAVHSLLLRINYDDLREDYEELVYDYVKELRSNIDFIGKAKMTLSSLAEEISEVKGIVNPVTGELESLIVDSKPTKKKTTKKTTKKKN